MARTTAEQYLIRAAAAEAIADKMEDGHLRQAWVDIADAYRELAKCQSQESGTEFPRS